MAWFRTSGNNGGSLKVLTASGDIASFETNLPEPLQSVTVDVEATGGNGTPDNPNPINGYSSANITRCGVNLFNKNDASSILNAYVTNKINTLSTCRTVFVPCKPSTQYTVSKTAGQRFVVGYTKELPANNVDVYGNIQDHTASFITITTGADAKYLVSMVFNAGYDSITAEQMLASVQIVEGTDTTYHAYNGQTYTIAFDQTVYGGQLDVTRGKLHVTHGYAEYDGSNDESWALYSGQRFVVTVSDFTSPANSVVANIKCNRLATVSKASQGSTTGLISGSDEGYHQFMVNVGQSTVEDMRTWLSNNPLQVAYKLATPFDIDLTPDVISAIVGENNVFADCGSTTVEYVKRT